MFVPSVPHLVYIYDDERASLGHAALYRGPLAFMPDAYRERMELGPLVNHIPRALRLSEVLAALGNA